MSATDSASSVVRKGVTHTQGHDPMKTIRRFALPALLTAATAVAGLTAVAQAPADAPQKAARTMDVEQIKARGTQLFEATDADGNDTISRDEFAAAKPAHPPGKHRGHRRMHSGMNDSPEARAALFKALDADGSGQLSTAEFDQLKAKASELRRGAAFDRMDANKDGVLDATEYPPFVKRAAALDADGDGTVTAEERRAARPAKP